MTRIEYAAWPHAARSLGYYPPEAVIQIPIDVFVDLLDHAPKEKWPDWWKEPLKKQVPWTLMKASTLFDMLDSSTTAPQFFIDAADRYIKERNHYCAHPDCPGREHEPPHPDCHKSGLE